MEENLIAAATTTITTEGRRQLARHKRLLGPVPANMRPTRCRDRMSHLGAEPNSWRRKANNERPIWNLGLTLTVLALIVVIDQPPGALAIKLPSFLTWFHTPSNLSPKPGINQANELVDPMVTSASSQFSLAVDNNGDSMEHKLLRSRPFKFARHNNLFGSLPKSLLSRFLASSSQSKPQSRPLVGWPSPSYQLNPIGMPSKQPHFQQQQVRPFVQVPFELAPFQQQVNKEHQREYALGYGENNDFLILDQSNLEQKQPGERAPKPAPQMPKLSEEFREVPALVISDQEPVGSVDSTTSKPTSSPSPAPEPQLSTANETQSAEADNRQAASTQQTETISALEPNSTNLSVNASQQQAAESGFSSTVLTTLINEEFDKLRQEPARLNKTLESISNMPLTSIMEQAGARWQSNLTLAANSSDPVELQDEQATTGGLESAALASIAVAPEINESQLRPANLDSFILGPYNGDQLRQSVSHGQPKQQVVNSGRQKNPTEWLFASPQQQQPPMGSVTLAASSLLQQAKNLVLPFVGLQTAAEQSFRGQQALRSSQRDQMQVQSSNWLAYNRQPRLGWQQQVGNGARSPSPPIQSSSSSNRYFHMGLQQAMPTANQVGGYQHLNQQQSAQLAAEGAELNKNWLVKPSSLSYLAPTAIPHTMPSQQQRIPLWPIKRGQQQPPGQLPAAGYNINSYHQLTGSSAPSRAQQQPVQIGQQKHQSSGIQKQSAFGLVLDHRQQPASRFKSGLYQIDSPKLVAGQAEQQQQQQVEADEQAEIGQNKVGADEEANEDEDEEASEQPKAEQRVTEAPSESKSGKLAKQVGASIEVGAKNKGRAVVKGQVFSEPVAAQATGAAGPDEGRSSSQLKSLKLSEDITLYDVEVPQQQQQQQQPISYLDTQVYTVPYTVHVPVGQPMQPNYQMHQQQVSHFPLPYMTPPAHRPYRGEPRRPTSQDHGAQQSLLSAIYRELNSPMDSTDWTSSLPSSVEPNLNYQLYPSPTGEFAFADQTPRGQLQQQQQPNQKQQHYFHYQPVRTVEPAAQPVELVQPSQVGEQPGQQQQQQFMFAVQHQPSGGFVSAQRTVPLEAPAWPPSGLQTSSEPTEPAKGQEATSVSSVEQSTAAMVSPSSEPTVLVSSAAVEPSSEDSQDEAPIQLKQTFSAQRNSQDEQQRQEASQQASSPATFCAGRPAGLYADESQRCKAYYQCAPTGHQMFRCNNQTQFNQKSQNCDWWYNVDCGGRLGSPADFEPVSTSTQASETGGATQPEPSSTASGQERQSEAQQSAPDSGAPAGDNQPSRPRWFTAEPQQQQETHSEKDLFHHSESRFNGTVAPPSDQQADQMLATSSSISTTTAAASSSLASGQDEQATLRPSGAELAERSAAAPQPEPQSSEPQVGANLASGEDERPATSTPAAARQTISQAASSTSAPTEPAPPRRLVQSEFGLGVQQQQPKAGRSVRLASGPAVQRAADSGPLYSTSANHQGSVSYSPPSPPSPPAARPAAMPIERRFGARLSLSAASNTAPSGHAEAS